MATRGQYLLARDMRNANTKVGSMMQEATDYQDSENLWSQIGGGIGGSLAAKVALGFTGPWAIPLGMVATAGGYMLGAKATEEGHEFVKGADGFMKEDKYSRDDSPFMEEMKREKFYGKDTAEGLVERAEEADSQKIRSGLMAGAAFGAKQGFEWYKGQKGANLPKSNLPVSDPTTTPDPVITPQKDMPTESGEENLLTKVGKFFGKGEETPAPEGIVIGGHTYDSPTIEAWDNYDIPDLTNKTMTKDGKSIYSGIPGGASEKYRRWEAIQSQKDLNILQQQKDATEALFADQAREKFKASRDYSYGGYDGKPITSSMQEYKSTDIYAGMDKPPIHSSLRKTGKSKYVPDTGYGLVLPGEGNSERANRWLAEVKELNEQFPSQMSKEQQMANREAIKSGFKKQYAKAVERVRGGEANWQAHQDRLAKAKADESMLAQEGTSLAKSDLYLETQRDIDAIKANEKLIAKNKALLASKKESEQYIADFRKKQQNMLTDMDASQNLVDKTKKQASKVKVGSVQYKSMNDALAGRKKGDPKAQEYINKALELSSGSWDKELLKNIWSSEEFISWFKN